MKFIVEQNGHNLAMPAFFTGILILRPEWSLPSLQFKQKHLPNHIDRMQLKVFSRLMVKHTVCQLERLPFYLLISKTNSVKTDTKIYQKVVQYFTKKTR